MSTKGFAWLSADEERIWRDSLAAVAWIGQELDSILRPFDLNLNEYEVLVVLSESPDHRLRMSQLAEASNQSKSRLTHAVRRMEVKGWVARESCPNDGRGVIAVLTDEGFEQLKRAAGPHVESVRRTIVDPIDTDDLRAVGRAARAVLGSQQ